MSRPTSFDRVCPRPTSFNRVCCPRAMMACHHHLWTAHTVERRRAWAYTVEQRRAWHAIIAFGLADTVERRRAWHAIIAL